MTAAPELDGHAVVLTGGATGLGLAAARLMASRGATVWILGHDAEAVARAATNGLRALVADVSDADAVTAAFAARDADGPPLTGLVCSAGIQPFGTVETTSPDRWNNVLGVNLRGAYLCARAAVPRMRGAGQSSTSRRCRGRPPRRASPPIRRRRAD